MIKKLNIVHLGIGQVGRKLVEQILKRKSQIKDEYLLDLNYCGIFRSGAGFYKREGFSSSQLQKILQALEKEKKDPSKIKKQIQKALETVPPPFVLVDTTASNETFPLISTALEKGGYTVVSNKKPLSGRQRQFDVLQKIGRKRFYFETTVGAALPIIQTLKTLLDTGDEIIEIKGCFSGTLGFIFSELEKGKLFSEAVLEAKQKGFTEPDPRDDLSGLDVARKALILARLTGKRLELSDIKLTSLYPKRMDKLSIEDFLKSVNELDSFYNERLKQAKKGHKTLRFVATVAPSKCTVGLEEVEAGSDLGALHGPDNLIVFRTKRYFANPLVIKGPGAGVEVTACGVFGDILTVAKMV